MKDVNKAVICLSCQKEITKEESQVKFEEGQIIHTECLAKWWMERGIKLEYTYKLLKISTNLFPSNNSAIIEATKQEIEMLVNSKI